MVADVELHDVIREAAGNSILGRFMESIHALGLASRQATGTRARRCATRAWRTTGRSSPRCGRATPTAAADAMRHHLENVERAGRAS